MDLNKIVKLSNVDALRGLGVAMVLLYHTTYPYFSNFYLGVDLFFVLSGFLIFRTIIFSKTNNSFNLYLYYKRRFLRVAPALVFVISACMIFGYVFLAPWELKDLSQQAFSSIIFNSNHFFYLKEGYFNTVSAVKPLIHTWSLSVEFQFYLLAPILVIIIGSKSNHKSIFRASVILLCSFAVSIVLFYWDEKLWFFLFASRTFEFLCGGALCLFDLEKFRQKIYTPFLFLSGITLLFFAPILLCLPSFKNDWTSFLIYCSGLLGSLNLLLSALLTKENRSLPIILFGNLGLISYSVYLVHQPIYAFWRLTMNSSPTLPEWTLLIVSSIFCGCCLYFSVERFYLRKNVNLYGFSTVLFSCVLLAFAGLFGHYSKGFSGRIPSQYSNLIMPDVGQIKCETNVKNLLEGVYVCDFEGNPENSKHNWLIFGDSHAGMIEEALAKKLQESNISLSRFVIEDCEPFDGFFSSSERVELDCASRYQKFYETIEHYDNLIFLARYTQRLWPIGYQISSQNFDNGLGGNDIEHERKSFVFGPFGLRKYDETSKAKTLQNFFDKMIEKSNAFTLIYPVPEAGWHVRRAYFRQMRNCESRLNCEELIYDKNKYYSRNRWILSFFDNLRSEKIEKVKLSDIFCDKKIKNEFYCKTEDGGQSLYYDSNHLSKYGSSYVVQKIRIH